MDNRGTHAAQRRKGVSSRIEPRRSIDETVDQITAGDGARRGGPHMRRPRGTLCDEACKDDATGSRCAMRRAA
ncbi:hypothetical protein [Burkholderia singularis]|uniref:Uncharacterized protein n=1 Tax=Burkholderia singularis TaxID=1503053 RepID=A0A238HD02_9BURK|nr:hypothetical protein [Burkholderia singularis]SMG03058.1 hypothetical protein BSIN_1152 [Burkholderia singularis]